MLKRIMTLGIAAAFLAFAAPALAAEGDSCDDGKGAADQTACDDDGSTCDPKKLICVGDDTGDDTNGDDTTDEDLFAELPEGGIAVHVGSGPTRAPWNVDDWRGVRDLLDAVTRTVVA